mmetsp:Transcript_16272/g.21294  ORF Transcript_16272/g.21294 Transcript_16272/m.21294 type:complete len:166 (-) Transcript_16272:405-902(-)|eukprot:CAMPEP_0198145040 /NCGR_PEP_ID=MMETSP1443-20131203/20599_1 /TAXON_ID=186043 /ORGANISM="Entomoneis sp., Strain CCMP2396" /LENGTH=165 /DNA_ID=CAMNT_0043808555 /DNA_START=182 /DNA_END=679 /DNA_ORIENTATION=+
MGSTADEILVSSPQRGAIARASSILKRNAKLHGPMNTLTENSSTCWNSEGSGGDGGTEIQQQWIQVEFPAGKSVLPSAVCVQFQAGFSAETCTVEYLNALGKGWETISKEEVEWEDVHQLQRYDLDSSQNCSAIRLVWDDDFADLYGRVIIYQLQVWGSEESTDA